MPTAIAEKRIAPSSVNPTVRIGLGETDKPIAVPVIAPIEPTIAPPETRFMLDCPETRNWISLLVSRSTYWRTRTALLWAMA